MGLLDSHVVTQLAGLFFSFGRGPGWISSFVGRWKRCYTRVVQGDGRGRGVVVIVFGAGASALVVLVVLLVVVVVVVVVLLLLLLLLLV